MTEPRATLRDVLAGLEREGLVEAGWSEQAAALLADIEDAQPWYVRAMVGFGAWLASLLLISFVVGLSLVASGGGYLVLGVLFPIASILVRRADDNDFTNQMTLATSLAGQVLLAIGVAQLSNFAEFETTLISVIVINVVLIVIYPDATHRFLSVMFIATSAMLLLYFWRLAALIPVLGPLLAVALVVLSDREAKLVAAGWDDRVRPVMAGLMVSAFGCLLLSTLYVLPEIAREIVIYPRPWISTVMLGLLLLYVEMRVWPVLFGRTIGGGAITAYGLTVAVIFAALAAPGLLLALVVIALGVAQGSRPYIGAGLGFLVVFIGAYFYAIEVDMLTKSATLVATGAVILVSRWALLALADRDSGPAHA